MFRRWAASTAAALAIFALGSVGFSAAQGAVTRHYYTELYRYPQGGFPVSATLDLTFRPDGSLVGYYRPTDGGLKTVFGSVSDSHVSLTIGFADLHVTGTIGSDGKIEGRAFREYGRQIYTFVGRPIPNDGALPRVR